MTHNETNIPIKNWPFLQACVKKMDKLIFPHVSQTAFTETHCWQCLVAFLKVFLIGFDYQLQGKKHKERGFKAGRIFDSPPGYGGGGL